MRQVLEDVVACEKLAYKQRRGSMTFATNTPILMRTAFSEVPSFVLA
jgi:hypothetical protein